MRSIQNVKWLKINLGVKLESVIICKLWSEVHTEYEFNLKPTHSRNLIKTPWEVVL